ncbi:MAG: LSM domain-containing protein [Halobacteria archaeon]|nr:LSM domain-containing protein [Halobacteria archaeon]
MQEMPLDVLEDHVDSQVVVRLKDGERFVGTLTSFDQHMNVVLDPLESEEVEEYTHVEDTTVIRGDNVVSIRL